MLVGFLKSIWQKIDQEEETFLGEVFYSMSNRNLEKMRENSLLSEQNPCTLIMDSMQLLCHVNFQLLSVQYPLCDIELSV